MRGVHQTSEHEVIRLLAQWSNGDKSAFDKLMPLITMNCAAWRIAT